MGGRGALLTPSGQSPGTLVASYSVQDHPQQGIIGAQRYTVLRLRNAGLNILRGNSALPSQSFSVDQFVL